MLKYSKKHTHLMYLIDQITHLRSPKIVSDTSLISWDERVTFNDSNFFAAALFLERGQSAAEAWEWIPLDLFRYKLPNN